MLLFPYKWRQGRNILQKPLKLYFFPQVQLHQYSQLTLFHCYILHIKYQAPPLIFCCNQFYNSGSEVSELMELKAQQGFYVILQNINWVSGTAILSAVAAGERLPRAPYLVQHLTKARNAQVSFLSPEQMAYCCVLRFKNTYGSIPTTRFAFGLTDG